MKIFYICSFGGCASTLLYRFLNKYGIAFHIHSRFPPNFLCSIRKTKLSKKLEWFNYSHILNQKDVKKVKVIYIYRKPSNLYYLKIVGGMFILVILE